MNYIDEEYFVLAGTYQNNTEEIDCAGSKEELYDLIPEYRLAFGSDWSFEVMSRPQFE